MDQGKSISSDACNVCVVHVHGGIGFTWPDQASPLWAKYLSLEHISNSMAP